VKPSVQSTPLREFWDFGPVEDSLFRPYHADSLPSHEIEDQFDLRGVGGIGISRYKGLGILPGNIEHFSPEVSYVLHFVFIKSLSDEFFRERRFCEFEVFFDHFYVCPVHNKGICGIKYKIN
jgi:hypothetical protein